MKKILFLTGAALMLCTAASAQIVANGNCGASGNNPTWVLTGTSPNYTLTISGTGEMATYAS